MVRWRGVLAVDVQPDQSWREEHTAEDFCEVEGSDMGIPLLDEGEGAVVERGEEGSADGVWGFGGVDC